MAVFRGPEEEDEGAEARRRNSPPGGGGGYETASFWWIVVQFLRRHPRTVLGVVIGLWAGFGIMGIGILWTLFISACVGLGYFIGRRLDENQEGLLDFLDRVLPPGRG